jgi:predicted O-linked N-acetylglucosamine transferase (SPINDLY family)
LPCLDNGWITFGSFNSPAKITSSVLELWANLMAQTPHSKLLFHYSDIFSNQSARDRVMSVFQSSGIDEGRLIFNGGASGGSLERYSLADIALDTFPFSGMTTTFEALWMGVPVVALEGDRMVGRYASTALRKAGLGRFVAADESAYLATAGRLASSPQELTLLRHELRAQVADSPLCAERARSRQLERLYRHMHAVRQLGSGRL